MTNKLLKLIKKGIVALVIGALFIPTMLKVDFDYQIHLIILLGFCFLFVSTYSILNIKKSDLIGSKKFFPYKSSFIGVDYWGLIAMGILLGVLKYLDGNLIVGILLVAFWVTDLAERIVKNKSKVYNLFFDEDRIIVNEDRYNEILYNDISSIEMIDSKTFKVLMKNKKEKVILNVDRIAKDLREAFTQELHSLNSRLNITLTENSL